MADNEYSDWNKYYDIKDERGKPYDVFVSPDKHKVSVFSQEGKNERQDVSGNAVDLLIRGECEYPLDVDEWDIWLQ